MQIPAQWLLHITSFLCDNSNFDTNAEIMQTDNLISLKDDMVAFIVGHGMRRLTAYVSEDVPSIMFDEDNPDGWKDFVEHAKAAGAAFITMSEIVLDKADIEILIEQLREGHFPQQDLLELNEAQYLVNYVGKTGYLQLGFAHQGVMFLYETSTEWYERFQQLMESLDDFSTLLGSSVDDSDDDDD